MWEELTKGEAIERPRREDLVSGGKFGDWMIGGSKASEQDLSLSRTSPCPERDDEGQTNYRQ